MNFVSEMVGSILPLLIIMFIVKKYKSRNTNQLKVIEAEKNIYRSGYNYSSEEGEFWSITELEIIARSRIPVPNFPWVDWNVYANWFLFTFLHKDVRMEPEIIEHNLTIIENLTNDEAQSLYVQFRGEFKELKKLIYRSIYISFNESELIQIGNPHILGFNYFNKNGKLWLLNDLEELAGTRIRVPGPHEVKISDYPHFCLFHILHNGVPMEYEIIEHNLTIIESLTNDEAKRLYYFWK